MSKIPHADLFVHLRPDVIKPYPLRLDEITRARIDRAVADHLARSVNAYVFEAIMARLEKDGY